MDFYFIQFLNGLASASSLFLVASGLSIIFGVTRITNFAHGAFYMLGAYMAYSFTEAWSGALGFWGGILAAAVVVAIIGALVEIILLRRIYNSPELFQLLATFGVTLIIQDLVIWGWGTEELLGRKAPGLEGAVTIFGQAFPTYDLMLIVLGPLVLGILWLLFHRTRWGVLVRAATQDRMMVSALGVNQAHLFTGVFTLGIFLAALGGAVQIPKTSIEGAMDLQIIVEAFVVVVIGGFGNVLGAFLAAFIISELNAFGILLFPKISLVLMFIVMAIVLVVRPYGLLGKAEAHPRSALGNIELPIAPLSLIGRYWMVAVIAVLALLPVFASEYVLSVGIEILIFALFAASLHLMMGVGGMVSFGHAAYFGLGVYGSALLFKFFEMPMLGTFALAPLFAFVGAVIFGWFCVRLSGVYLAMLTLAFAQITWSIVFQWDEVTGGDNGIVGVWASDWASDTQTFYYLTLAICTLGIIAIRHIVFSPFGYTLRACRDSLLRSDAIGIDRLRIQWFGFILAGTFAGIGGMLFTYIKLGANPEYISIPYSVDGLVMVLLGGIQTVTGPIVGAGVFKALSTYIISHTEFWKSILGVMIVVLVVLFPQGIVGFFNQVFGKKYDDTPASSGSELKEKAA